MAHRRHGTRRLAIGNSVRLLLHTCTNQRSVERVCRVQICMDWLDVTCRVTSVRVLAICRLLSAFNVHRDVGKLCSQPAMARSNSRAPSKRN